MGQAGARRADEDTRCSTRADVHRLRRAASRSPGELLAGDATGAVGTLKTEPGNDFVVLGGGELVRSLMPPDLVEEYTLLIRRTERADSERDPPLEPDA